jgi:CBS-domain-containing membrane protein
MPKVHPAEVTTAEIQALFTDDHVHMALLVDTNGRLVTTIERGDLNAVTTSRAADIGTLDNRTMLPDATLDEAIVALQRGRRRRLAVIDVSGRLVGLLCLKRSGDGFCTDEGIRNREAERRRLMTALAI